MYQSFLNTFTQSFGKRGLGKNTFHRKGFSPTLCSPFKVFEEGCGEKTFSKKFLPAINLLSQIPLKREKWNKLFYF